MERNRATWQHERNRLMPVKLVFALVEPAEAKRLETMRLLWSRHDMEGREHG